MQWRKPQENLKKNFLRENQNCDEVTVEKKGKKKVITMPEEGLTKEEEHYATNQIIRKFQKLSKSLCSICAESLKVKLNLYCSFCRNFYHSSCAHPTCNFTSTFPSYRYICQSCIENNYKSFHCYTSFHLSAELHNYTEDADCISKFDSTTGKNFLTISKKIVKMCLFLQNTTTEVQAKMYFYQYIQSEV